MSQQNPQDSHQQDPHQYRHRSLSMSSLDPKPHFQTQPNSIFSKFSLSKLSPSFSKDKPLEDPNNHPISHSSSSSFSSTSSGFTPLSTPSSSPLTNSPISQLLPNLFPVKINPSDSETAGGQIQHSQPVRRASMGPGGIFGLTGMNNPVGGGAGVGSDVPPSPTSQSGLWRRFSLGGSPLNPPTLPSLAPVSPTSSTRESLPPVFEEVSPSTPPSADARGRSFGRRQSTRKVSPMGERMLRGPFHD